MFFNSSRFPEKNKSLPLLRSGNFAATSFARRGLAHDGVNWSTKETIRKKQEKNDMMIVCIVMTDSVN
jgi:hypothetical protein